MEVNSLPILSIIVPVYNKVKYIDKCIQSLRQQSLKDISIILVDDGSDDGSIDICKKHEMEDDRIILICKDHQGPICARYEGTLVATSEYVTFVDADDWVEQTAYESILEYISEGYDVIKYLMVHDWGNTSTNYKNKYKVGSYDRKRIEEEIFPTLIWDVVLDNVGASSSLCDKILRKKILLNSFKKALHLNYHYCEDSTVSYPMYEEVQSLYISDKVLYHHCKYDGEEGGYIKNDSFFDDLYLWYKHLRKYTAFLPDYISQVEGMYMAAMQPRKSINGAVSDRVRFLFPFNKIEKNARVVIWGFGNVGKSYMDQLRQTDYCEIVDVVDKNFNQYQKFRVKNPEIIKEIAYDYIIVAIYDIKISESIKNQLLQWGVSEEKIIFMN